MHLTVKDCCVNMNKIHEQGKQDVFAKKKNNTKNMSLGSHSQGQTVHVHVS